MIPEIKIFNIYFDRKNIFDIHSVQINMLILQLPNPLLSANRLKYRHTNKPFKYKISSFKKAPINICNPYREAQ